MTTLHEFGRPARKACSQVRTIERRRHRRHDMEPQSIRVDRHSGKTDSDGPLGHIVDLSSGGIRVRTTQTGVQSEQQIRFRMELPAYAGISPFIDGSSGSLRPKNEWVGWMAVTRVVPAGNGQYDVAGRLLDMEDLDRGMLGLYLSTQPVAA